jgi:dolichol-phosphate mannosyltransferase
MSKTESEKISVSIIIPAYNEEDCIENTVRAVLKEVKIPGYEILICNDHSKDSTLEIAKRLAKEDKRVRVMTNTRDNGFGNVMRFGFENAKGEFVVPMMADLCDDPKTVNKMYEKAKQGYDVVVGSRYIKGGKKKNVHNHFKSFCSWFVGKYGRYIAGVNSHDSTNAFKMMRRQAILDIKPTSNNFDISLEMSLKFHKKGLKITEVPTVWTDRTGGESKFQIYKLYKRYIRWLKI